MLKKKFSKSVKLPKRKKQIIGENIYIFNPKIENRSTGSFMFLNFLYKINRPLKKKICKT